MKKKLKLIATKILELYGGRSIQLYSKKNSDIVLLFREQTSFLNDNSGLIERSYCIANDIKSYPTCKQCANVVTWNKTQRTYRTYCSTKCKTSDASLKEIVKNTFKNKYGVENPSQIANINEKKKQSCLKNHGVEWAQQSKIVRRKTKQTYLKNHGVEHFNNRDLSKQTCLERYGVENPSQVPSIQNKKITTCLKKYNTKHALQKHINKEILKKLNDADWMFDQHIIQEKPLLLIAKELNINDGTVGRYLHMHGIDTQNFSCSIAENEVGSFIEQSGFKILKNKRNIIPKNLELDIFIPELNIAFEYCGLYYHSEEMGKDKNYHKQKYELCKKQNIRLITIFEDEWLYKSNIVKSKIRSILHKNITKTIYARKTVIKSVPINVKREFLNKYHIQGNGGGSISYGLYNDIELVACMTIINNKHNNYIINRYATKYNITGGFSKILTYFKKSHTWNTITTFADLRWSEGHLYTLCNFELEKILPPDYTYISAQQRIRIHKFNYRKNRLKKKLDKYDPTLTENENLLNNNIYKIWNCGLNKFILINN